LIILYKNGKELNINSTKGGSKKDNTTNNKTNKT